jgi:DNA end-binding protein Ku
MSGKAHVAVVRPLGKVLCMTLLAFADEVRSPEEFQGEVGGHVATPKETKLAEELVQSATDPEFELARYKDDYAERIAKLIAKKTKKKEVNPRSRGNDSGHVGDLMDALRQSLTQERRRSGRRQRTAAKSTRTPSRSKSRSHA